MKLNIDENKFLAAVDTEGDPEVGVGMADIVERLRKWSVFGYGYEASCDMKEAATAIELQRISVAHAAKLLSERTAEIERLRAALEDVMIGGNSLAQIIGADHPPHGTPYSEALAYYGGGVKYEAWCCWNTIMQARAALEEGRT